MADNIALSDEEASAAAQVAEQDEGVKRLAPGRTRVVGTRPLLTSERHRPKGRRHAVVGLYDYSNSRSVVAVVDLEANKVVGVDETPAQFQLHPDEQEEAERLAGEDSRVQEFLAGREMRPLTRLYFPGAQPAADRQHRFAIVFLRPSTRERKYAVIDLSERAVVGVIGPDVITPQ